jgi:hypothetical protein
MDKREAIELLLEVLPEFGPEYEKSVGHPGYDEDGELLLHIVMGDLCRFYMSLGRRDTEIAARFWGVVEEMAEQGDEAVQNAVHVSLIEWFAWGDATEQAALLDASALHGDATTAMVRQYLPVRVIGSRRSDRRRARMNRRQ